MAEPLTAADLEQIAERASKATPGPWNIWSGETFDKIYGGSAQLCAHLDRREDARFIAAAREDVPRLLATVEARDAEIVALREIVAAVADAHEVYTDYAGLETRFWGVSDAVQGLARALLGE